MLILRPPPDGFEGGAFSCMSNWNVWLLTSLNSSAMCSWYAHKGWYSSSALNLLIGKNPCAHEKMLPWLNLCLTRNICFLRLAIDSVHFRTDENAGEYQPSLLRGHPVLLNLGNRALTLSLLQMILRNFFWSSRQGWFCRINSTFLFCVKAHAKSCARMRTALSLQRHKLQCPLL